MAFVLRHSLLLIILGSLVISTAMGLRHGFGLFMEPLSSELGWGRGVFAFALALQNLVWGLSQPFTGALADRFGAARIIVVGGLLYALGLLFMSLSTSELGMTVSAGLLIGLGLSGTTFSVILGAVGRAVAPEKRSMAMGIVSAAGSFGQFAMLPGTLGLLEWLGWAAALMAMAAIATIILPLGAMLRDKPSAKTASDLSLKDALNEAAGQKGFWLLCLGFFVCGFQVVFIAVHLPGYLFDNGLAVKVGTTVLALVGLFNIVGTYTAGWMGGIWSKPKLLTWLYLIRGVVITAFVYLPLSPTSASLFGIVMGLLWLSTVPLTNGIVASVFGVRHLSMLGGIVFLFHQLGSFMGVWLGGYFYDLTGNYNTVWQIAIVLSVVAAALHWFINEKPLERSQSTTVIP
ncbi:MULTISPECIES: MFS transporter [Halomonadaceae]|jgi:MFS family permease|uniref:MFS transporter n=1 Tax=Halomonadaceae TaxID=28256 RepID=UPI0012EFFF7D|nr:MULTISPECIES: MFS transporter [Halomonas]CAD5260263.1 MFS transporter [Halomonas sp. 156]CAD5288736.1 MFS transporter [Halomonas sp. 113]CAD5290124.1 MFS transporter [Halomonas sp. 59]CAD5294060.1 Permeases of the major facilitator superfamily [Halomonas sp. I3]VXB47134.1 MFS transporter [Halomonas titanicae]